jgi:hypothetical protein
MRGGWDAPSKGEGVIPTCAEPRASAGLQYPAVQVRAGRFRTNPVRRARLAETRRGRPHRQPHHRLKQESVMEDLPDLSPANRPLTATAAAGRVSPSRSGGARVTSGPVAIGSTGSVVEPGSKQRSWALRFRAYGKRRFVTLGRPEGGWTRERAEADCVTSSPTPSEVSGSRMSRSPSKRRRTADLPPFRLGVVLGDRGRAARADAHRLPLATLIASPPPFATFRLSAITVEEVDRYRRAKERERGT